VADPRFSKGANVAAVGAPPQKIFELFIWKSRYLVHSDVFFKVYIPTFACHVYARKAWRLAMA